MSTNNPNADLAAKIRDQRLRSELAGTAGTPIIAMLGGSAFEYPAAMHVAWDGYWGNLDLIDKGPIAMGSGGKLSRVSADQAVYWRDGIEPFTIRHASDFNLVANLDPSIGEVWERDFPGWKVTPL